MTVPQKTVFFEHLVRCGFKEIEIAYPAASDTDFGFVQGLIEGNQIPDDVWIQVRQQQVSVLFMWCLAMVSGPYTRSRRSYSPNIRIYRRGEECYHPHVQRNKPSIPHSRFPKYKRTNGRPRGPTHKGYPTVGRRIRSQVPDTIQVWIQSGDVHTNRTGVRCWDMRCCKGSVGESGWRRGPDNLQLACNSRDSASESLCWPSEYMCYIFTKIHWPSVDRILLSTCNWTREDHS